MKLAAIIPGSLVVASVLGLAASAPAIERDVVISVYQGVCQEGDFEANLGTVRSDDGQRWIITAWDPVHRCWGNERCPCLHSDPQFPDCPPGETKRLRGWLSFYEGTDIDSELLRIEAAGWRNPY